MNANDFNRLIDPIKRKIFLLIGRAILTAVNNSGKTMKIQVTLLDGETVTDIERFEDYGFASYPKKGSAEAVIGFINGNREHGIALKVHDRGYRPMDLTEGDSRVYDYRGNKITCKSTGVEIEDKNGMIIKMEAAGITIQTGDATPWKPCIIANCIFSGAPHGGSVAGIVKMKGA